MRLQIIIQTDNEAFEGSPGAETARILEELARTFRGKRKIFNTLKDGALALVDANGNTIGHVKAWP